MKIKNSGIAIATIAAALFASASMAADAQQPATTSASSAKVHCQGINQCKGHSECNTASNACAGLNSCKGKGWITVTKEECAKKGGTVVG